MAAKRRMVADRLPPLQLPDLTGRRAVVTGASSGIGFATARGLAAAGASVVLAVRDESRGASAAAAIRASCPGATVDVELLELGSLLSIASFARRVGSEPVHLLINNAGMNARPDARSEEGFDLTGRRELPRRLGPHRRTVAGAGRGLGTCGEPRFAGCRSGQDRPGVRHTHRVDLPLLRRLQDRPGRLRRRAPAPQRCCRCRRPRRGSAPGLVPDTDRRPATAARWVNSPANSSAPCSHRPTAPSPSCWRQRTRVRARTTARPDAEAQPAHRGRRHCHGRPWSPTSGSRLWEMSTELTGVALEP